MLVQVTNSGPVVRAYGGDKAIVAETDYQPIALSPTVVQETEHNVILNKNTSAGATPKWRLSADVSVKNLQITNLNPEQATLNNSFLTAEVGATGLCRIVLSAKGRAGTMLTFTVNQTGAIVTYTLNDFVADTHPKISWDNVLSKLIPDKVRPYYNGNTYAECLSQPGGISRNPDCWGAGYDFSGVAVTHLDGGFWGGGALITPRHYVVSNHYRPSNKVGMVLRFVGNDGSVHTRTVLAQTTGSEIPGYIANPLYPIGDVAVFLLSGPDLPEEVTVYPIVGDWFDQFAATGSSGGIVNYIMRLGHVFVTIDQNRHVVYATSTRDWLSFQASETPEIISVRGFTYTKKAFAGLKYIWGPLYTLETEKRFEPRIGDSGSVLFSVNDSNNLAIASLCTSTSDGPYLHPGLLNALILEVDDRAGISTGLTVTVAPDPTL
jgi:hypothetical protein